MKEEQGRTVGSCWKQRTAFSLSVNKVMDLTIGPCKCFLSSPSHTDSDELLNHICVVSAVVQHFLSKMWRTH